MNKWLIGLCYFSFLLYSACTYDQISVIEVCDNDITLMLTEQTPPACGVASGAFTVAAEGTVEGIPVTYSLNGGNFADVPTFANLSAGSYIITAKQGVCEATIEVNLENAEGLKASAELTPSNCSTASGTITVNTTDASGQVTFTLDGNLEQTSATFTGLTPGSYQVTAKDEIGCQVTLEVTVPSDVGFEEIKALVTASCAVSGCHAGNIAPDLRVDQNILDRAERIGTRTGNRSMPPSSSGRSLTQNQIDAIRCWIDDGASE